MSDLIYIYYLCGGGSDGLCNTYISSTELQLPATSPLLLKPLNDRSKAMHHVFAFDLT